MKLTGIQQDDTVCVFVSSRLSGSNSVPSRPQRFVRRVLLFSLVQRRWAVDVWELSPSLHLFIFSFHSLTPLYRRLCAFHISTKWPQTRWYGQNQRFNVDPDGTFIMHLLKDKTRPVCSTKKAEEKLYGSTIKYKTTFTFIQEHFTLRSYFF